MLRGALAGAGLLLLTGFTAVQAAPATNPNCRNTGDFDRWLAEFKREALSHGIAQGTINAASPHLKLEQRIINIDRGQRFFAQGFLEFSDKMVPRYRIERGASEIKKHAETFARIDQQYGVPAPVIAAFWGLESDFGANSGKEPILPAIASLAYDCRRSAMFREQLMNALQLIQKGDLRVEEMIGSWAGELGQTQMMPAEYNKYAVDFDGDSRRNLIKSAPDVLASTANYLGSLGWRRGEPWLQEVRVPRQLPWDQADLAIQHPRSQWAKWGVTRANGQPLQNDSLAASLMLPLGRFGPAFLAYQNFQTYTAWNNSLVYALTAAYYATRLDGAPAMFRGKGVPEALSFDETRALQQTLAARGYDVGRVDGILGLKSRAAVKDMQKKLGLPADSYPTQELVERMRANR